MNYLAYIDKEARIWHNYVMEDKQNDYVRTTLYVSRKLHDDAKMMAVLTHTSMSHIMCIALREKLDQLKKESKNRTSKQ